jgi:hypothetical protein
MKALFALLLFEEVFLLLILDVIITLCIVLPLESLGWFFCKSKEDVDNISKMIDILKENILQTDQELTTKTEHTMEATNNTFKIIGIEEYPYARLIIISKEGKTLFDLFPYKNDFDGKNLPNGTYYYMFNEEYYSPPIKKGFFEIVK